MPEVYYKVHRVLQSMTDCYYKVRQVLQSVTVIINFVEIELTSTVVERQSSDQ